MPRPPAWLVTMLLAACAPTMNWREIRPEGSGAVVMLPCKPASHARRVPLAGAPVELSLYACSAGDATWALGFADVGDPARLGPALRELREAAVGNIGGVAPRPLPLAVPGATPHPETARLATEGRLADGRAVHEQVAVFAKGTRVFQATAVGAQLPDDALQTFFGSLATP